jgi:hypothetical protein
MIMLTFHADHAMTMAMADGVPTGNVKLYCITVMYTLPSQPPAQSCAWHPLVVTYQVKSRSAIHSWIC